jgi:hypothetical protein
MAGASSSPPMSVIASSLHALISVSPTSGVSIGRTSGIVTSFTRLQAFELALGGDALGAGEMLAELERQRAEHDWTRSVAWLHPYLTGINRLAAARWLRESGRPADAERLLRWSEGVEFPGYLVSEARALLDAPVYYERALAAEALGGSDVALSHYAQFLRRYDSPIDAHRDLVERAERIMRETPRDR